METTKEFLIEWLKSYTGLNTQSIYDLAKEVDNRYTKALQFQQTGVKQSVCNSELDCPFDFTSRCTIGRCDCKPKQIVL